MRRSVVLKAKIAEKQHALNQAINARAEAVRAVSHAPDDEAAHAKLTAALDAVPALQRQLEALDAAHADAERHDERDRVDEARDGLLKAKEEAIALANSRAAIGKEIDTWLGKLPALLAKLQALNERIHERAASAGAGLKLPHDNGLHVGALVSHCVRPIYSSTIGLAFVQGLNAAGLGVSGAAIDTAIPNPGGARLTVEQAIYLSSEEVASALKDLHIRTGVITGPSEMPVDAAPMIAPPKETWIKVKDPETGEMVDQLYTSDVVETTWTAKQ